MELLRGCAALGFARAGICDARPSDHAGHVRRWIVEGRHGQMHYLERRLEMRLDPRVLVPGARSILVVADRYSDGRRDRRDVPLRGRLGRYARGRDYHLVMRRRLETLRDECLRRWPQERFRVCVDTAPLLEREHAARAGLGAIGKHTLLIEPSVGSWMLLGAIVTTLPLEPPGSALSGDPCGSCTRCIEACPTSCIEPWSVDASACVSYLTIEHRDVIAEQFHEAMGDWLVGCDVCQEVCPHAQPTRRSRGAPRHQAYAAERLGFDALEVLAWTEDDWERAVRGTALERVSLAMFRRNAAIVAANTCPAGRRMEVATLLASIAADPGEPEMVRHAAAAGARRLGGAAHRSPEGEIGAAPG